VLRRFSARVASARAAAGVPVLFSRYDHVFDELHGAGAGEAAGEADGITAR
jgi:hypothetical protein